MYYSSSSMISFDFVQYVFWIITWALENLLSCLKVLDVLFSRSVIILSSFGQTWHIMSLLERPHSSFHG